MTETATCMLSSSAMWDMIIDKIGWIRGTSVRARSARAVVALGVGTVAGRGTRFAKNVILAKFLLAPDQLGMMAIVMSFSMAFEALIDVGVKQSIIHNKRGADEEYLNAAWWMQVVRGICIFTIASLLAPWISSFYDEPELSRLLQVALLAVVLRGLISPRAYVLEKEFKFGQAVLLLQGSAVLGAIAAVGLAVVMRNVWALVLGFVAEMLIMCILSFILLPFLPRLRIDKGSLSELVRYARRMFGLPILTALSVQAPILILGKVISKEQLGLYSLAAMLAYIPIDLYQRMIAPVLLPAFAEKQDDKSALCRGVLQSARLTAFIAMPLIAFMACSASELLAFVYTPKWAEMAIPLSVLCMQILFAGQAIILAGMYLAVGQPHIQRRFAMMRTVVVIGLMYPAAVHLGPLGAAAVIVLSDLAVLAMQVLKAREVIDLELRRYVCSYIPGLLLALPVVAVFDVFWLAKVDSHMPILVIGATVFVVALVVGVFMLGRRRDCRLS